MNHNLGFEPVSYPEIAAGETFWDQCRACVNYPILESKGRKMCLCTAMLFYPERQKEQNPGKVMDRPLPYRSREALIGR